MYFFIMSNILRSNRTDTVAEQGEWFAGFKALNLYERKR